MKLRILSDLHLEFNDFKYNYLGEDVLILAGDISNGGVYGKKYLREFLGSIPPHLIKLMVAGNHEFYNAFSFQAENEYLLSLGNTREIETFFFLQNDVFYYFHEGIYYSFFGGTMFSECKDPVVEHSVADFRYIRKEVDTELGFDHWNIKDHYNQYRLFNKEFDNWIEKLEQSDSKFGIKEKGKRICISHFLPSWNSVHPKYAGQKLNSYFASDNEDRVGKVDLWIHGHCVDSETEILTVDGWKNYKTILDTDKIYNLNISTNEFEIDDIKEVVKWEKYSGDVYDLQTKSIDFSVSSKHNMIAKSPNSKINIYEPVDEFCHRENVRFILSGKFNNIGMNLPDRMLELYIAIAADGNVILNDNGTVLTRFRLKKIRKLEYIKELLNFLKIEFKEFNYEKDSCINFYLPIQLSGLNIKGLDIKLRDCNLKDCVEILNAYKNTDGGVNGKQNVIYTSKKEEVDILQHLFTINGYKCSFNFKKSGFCDNLGYTLYIKEKEETLFQKKYTKAEYTIRKADSELFWCISTNNGNFFMRRNGKVMLIGNTHCNLDYNIGNARVICNPRGYSALENPQFNPDLIIEI